MTCCHLSSSSLLQKSFQCWVSLASAPTSTHHHIRWPACFQPQPPMGWSLCGPQCRCPLCCQTQCCGTAQQRMGRAGEHPPQLWGPPTDAAGGGAGQHPARIKQRQQQQEAGRQAGSQQHTHLSARACGRCCSTHPALLDRCHLNCEAQGSVAGSWRTSRHVHVDAKLIDGAELLTQSCLAETAGCINTQLWLLHQQ